jgi:hypothetical protein
MAGFRGQFAPRLEIGRIDLKKQIPFFHLLVVVDRHANNRSRNARGDTDNVRPDLAIYSGFPLTAD